MEVELKISSDGYTLNLVTEPVDVFSRPFRQVEMTRSELIGNLLMSEAIKLMKLTDAELRERVLRNLRAQNRAAPHRLTPNAGVSGPTGVQTTTDEPTLTAGGGPLDRLVGRSVPERAKPLSYRQREMLRQAKDDWHKLPIGAGCTNSTLKALEKRALVEVRVRYEASRHVPGARVTVWEWRKTPNVELSR